MQARWYAEAGQWEQALAALSTLHESHPAHPRVLALLRDACLALEDWERLAGLLPALKRAGVMDQDQHRALERRVALARLEAAGGDADRLQAIHGELSKAVRRDPEVIRAFADQAIAAGRSDLAEPPLRAAIGRDWDEALIGCYGRLGGDSAESALKHVEEWLKSRPEDPELLLAAGRLAAARELWGRARSYLEASVGRRERADTLRLLGEIQQRMGDEPAARATRTRALELALPGHGLA
jgi:HemY protein